MITGRTIIPNDVFVLLCVTFQSMSDHLLHAAVAVQKESDSLGPDSTILHHLILANNKMGEIQSYLKIITEEMQGLEPKHNGG